jgi:uncharacterized lipoprotein YmbA
MNPSKLSMLLAAGTIAASCLTACGSSPPVRYYTLEPEPGASARGPSASTGAAAPLRVQRVSIPPELERRGLVQHLAAGQVRIWDSDSWAAPLDELIGRTVSTDLASRLGPASVVDAREPSTGEPRRLLFLDVSALSADPNCAITLRASWTLQSPNQSDQRATESIDAAPVAPCPAGMAPTISRALGQLTDRIAAAVTTH